MSEWPIELAWKACIPQGIEGSNPSLSAGLIIKEELRNLVYYGVLFCDILFGAAVLNAVAVALAVEQIRQPFS